LQIRAAARPIHSRTGQAQTEELNRRIRKQQEHAERIEGRKGGNPSKLIVRCSIGTDFILPPCNRRIGSTQKEICEVVNVPEVAFDNLIAITFHLI
jgi:hypothetical protein